MNRNPVPINTMNANQLAVMRTAVEYGFICAEKGMNLQMALSEFDAQMSDKPKAQTVFMASDKPNDIEQD